MVGCYWGAWTEREPLLGRAADEQIFAAVARGFYQPRVSEVLPMSSFAEGLHRIASRRVTARLVLRVKPQVEGVTHRPAVA